MKSIAIFKSNERVGYIDALKDALLAASSDVQVCVYTFEDDPTAVLDVQKHALVIVAGVERVPAALQPAMEQYLDNKGRVMLLGGPAFDTVTFCHDGKWLSKDEYAQTVIQQLSDDKKHLIYDTSDPSIVDRLRADIKDEETEKVELEVGDFGLEGSSAQLKCSVVLDDWIHIAYDFEPVDNNVNLLSFWAKREAPMTDTLYLDMYDTNGTRWEVFFPLNDEWTQYTFTANDFIKDAYSYRPPNVKQVDFSIVNKIRFGFAHDGSAIIPGDHTFYISCPTFYSVDAPEFAEYASTAPRLIDTVFPLHQQYPIRNGVSIAAYDNQTFISARDYILPATVNACHVRQQGMGYNNKRVRRFIPLLRVLDEKSMLSGYAAWINIFQSVTDYNGTMEGSMVGCFTAVSEDFYDANGIAAITEAAQAMLQPVLLLEGGADEFIYVESETSKITLGASYAPYEQADAKIEVALYQDDQLLYTVSNQDATVEALAHDIMSFGKEYELAGTKPNRVVTTLTVDGVVVDRICQNIRFWSPKPVEERSYVYREKGAFMKDGKPLHLFGVNYMPQYGMAQPIGALYEFYASAAAYDPDVVANDLDRIKDIGMNAVSVFFYSQHVKETNNMLDLLRMCEERGIYVDFAVRPHAYPMYEYDEQEVEEMIRKLHLAEQDIIVAYDIAWERGIGRYEYLRKKWDGDWAEWIVDQYGSLEHAEELWGCSVNRDEQGNIIGVTDAMLNDLSGEPTKIVSAYRRFVDDIVAKIFNEKLLHMRSLVPNQMISFRMHMAGCARTKWLNPAQFKYDYLSLASTLDINEPEGYYLFEDRHANRECLFAQAYSRYTNPDAPLVWKEFGRRARSCSDFYYSESGQKAAANWFQYIYEAFLNSNVGGSFVWWFPGGFRVGENSDHGIINPDGSDRLLTKVIREYGPKFLAKGQYSDPDLTITVERDDHNRGIFGMYDQITEQLDAAIDGKKSIAFVNKKQSSVNDIVYADTTLNEAVGGTAATGQYPLRYVNGMIKNFEPYEKNGKTYAKITICNTLPSVWKAGTVSVVSVDGSSAFVDTMLDTSVRYLANVTINAPVCGKGALKLRLSINGVAFGMPYKTEV